jgi:peroxiredoxin
MLALGTPMPAFELPDLNGAPVRSDDLRGAAAVLVAFICPHCPFVQHIRRQFAQCARDYEPRGLSVIGINANDAVASPLDGLEGMREEAEAAGYNFPYLHDESQQVAKAFQAACTPDLFLFDRSGRLVYRGQFDDSRPANNIPVTGSDLRAAVEAVLSGTPVPDAQKPSIGCNIKWKTAR